MNQVRQRVRASPAPVLPVVDVNPRHLAAISDSHLALTSGTQVDHGFHGLKFPLKLLPAFHFQALEHSGQAYFVTCFSAWFPQAFSMTIPLQPSLNATSSES